MEWYQRMPAYVFKNEKAIIHAGPMNKDDDFASLIAKTETAWEYKDLKELHRLTKLVTLVKA